MHHFDGFVQLKDRDGFLGDVVQIPHLGDFIHACRDHTVVATVARE